MARHLPRDDLEAAVEARHELRAEREPELIDSFLDRIEREIDARVDERIERSTGETAMRRYRGGGPDWAAAILGISSLGIGIGATGASVGNGASWVAPFAWLAVVLVNWLYYQARGR